LAISTGAGLAWQRWRASAAEVYAPQLWLYEVISVLRKSVYAGTLDASEAEAGIATALALEVTLVAADDELCRSALRWAERLGQNAAYDGFYLALASRLQAEFWTTDRRLVNAAREAGVTWTHWIGELEAKEI
jgi:predicted nucleic acid-binding protein